MSYRVWVEPQALAEAKASPGNVRQRIKRMLKALAAEPRPSDSKPLKGRDGHFEPRRIRTGDWRIVYAVDDGSRWVWVLAIRKRPPYDYGDLDKLFRRIEG